MDKLDVVVLGAGVVGLAVGRAFALAGRSVVVLEQRPSFGMEISSRSSEVIHAGIYYPEGSLKAKFCVKGKQQLYQYCGERDVEHRRIGKIIVAVTEEETGRLQGYIDNARANGVKDLVMLKASHIQEIEPEVNAVADIYSPSTGIVDSHHLMFSYLTDIENSGGALICKSEVLSGQPVDGGMQLQVGGEFPYRCECRTVINATGLHAQQMATKLGVDSQYVPPAYYTKGQYYTLSGKSPFNQLVYPMADHASLGVHVTLDTAGQVRFGPDVEWCEGINYDFDDSRRSKFVEAIRRYYPGLDESKLQPGYVGVRPKIAGPNDPADDFVIQTEAEHGIPGLVNLFGIESPGLTSSMAIADEVVLRAG